MGGSVKNRVNREIFALFHKKVRGRAASSSFAERTKCDGF
jgi:hypothetical protein